MLSILTITWHPLSEGRKWISARKIALSSRQFMCQERNSPVQTQHAGLSSKTMPQPVRDASVVTIWRLWIGSILTPLWRKKGTPRTRHIKRVRKQLRDTLLGEWLVLWSGPLKFSSTKGTASCEATPGAWGLRASDKCSRRHNGLAWSRPNVYWGWKSGQEPDGPTFEQNPSELPKTLRWEGERTPLFVVHSEAKSMNMAEDDINVTTHWLPGVGQNGSWVNECPGTSKGPEQHPCTLWTSLVPKLGQREETCFGTPSLQKRTEGTSCAAEWPKYEHRHLSGQQWQTSLPLESVT